MAISPLALRKSDFQNEKLHVEENRLYRMWFELLALSPSYELARRYRSRNGKLSAKDQARLPKDFAKVLEIYDAFGNVQKYLFKTWLVERGVGLFGVPGKPSSVVPLSKISQGAKAPNQQVINKAIAQYLGKTWPSQNKPGAIILAIPLDSTRQKVLKSIKKILDDYIEVPTPPETPKFSLATKGVHMQNITDAMSVLWIRASRPDWKLWQIGEECKIRKNRKPRSYEHDATGEMRALEQMTSRKLKTAAYIAENAARGVFPSQSKPKHFVKFDPIEFNQIISEKNAWVKKERACILAQNKSQ